MRRRIAAGLTEADCEHITETVASLRAGQADCEYCVEEVGHETECVSDCYSSETIMTSRGYVEVYADGSVVAFGRTIWQCE